MFETLSQKLKANFTPEQQDYYLQLENELKELLNGQTQEEVLAGGDPAIIQKILEIKQEMLNFVLTKKTREMVRQEEYQELKQEKIVVSLDEIEAKQYAGEELTDNELRFLYNISVVELIDPVDVESRTNKIIYNRDIKRDVSSVLGCDPSKVSLTKEEFLNEVDVEYYFGDLSIVEEDDFERLKLPKIVG